MSLVDGLLVQAGTIVRRTQTGPEDRYNEPTWEETSQAVSCYVEQRKPSEETIGRTTAIGEYLGVFPAGTLVDASDELIVGAHRYKVVGPPWEVVDPFLGGAIDHIEVDLREET